MSKIESQSELSAAVQALDEELSRFEQLAQSAKKMTLTSERNLEKAARTINEAAASQKRVSEHIARLIDAIGAARQRHDETANALVATRDEVQARAERYQAQLERLAELGREAAEVSALVKQLGEWKGRPPGELVAQLDEVRGRMGRVAAGAHALGEEAERETMEDLARQCDALEQQVRSALNKVTLLRDKLAIGPS